MDREVRYRLEYLNKGRWWHWDTYKYKRLITTPIRKLARQEGDGDQIRVLRITQTTEILS